MACDLLLFAADPWWHLSVLVGPSLSIVTLPCRQKVLAAEDAVQAQALTLTTTLEEKASLDSQLQGCLHQLAAAQAAALAAGQQKDGDLRLLAAQLKARSTVPLCSVSTILSCVLLIHNHYTYTY